MCGIAIPVLYGSKLNLCKAKQMNFKQYPSFAVRLLRVPM